MGILKNVVSKVGATLSKIDPTKSGTITNKVLMAETTGVRALKNVLDGKSNTSGVGKLALTAAGASVGIPPSVTSIALDAIKPQQVNLNDLAKSAVQVVSEPTAGIVTTASMPSGNAIQPSLKTDFDWKSVGKDILSSAIGAVDKEASKIPQYEEAKSDAVKNSVVDWLKEHWYVPAAVVILLIIGVVQLFRNKKPSWKR